MEFKQLETAQLCVIDNIDLTTIVEDVEFVSDNNSRARRSLYTASVWSNSAGRPTRGKKRKKERICTSEDDSDVDFAIKITPEEKANEKLNVNLVREPTVAIAADMMDWLQKVDTVRLKNKHLHGPCMTKIENSGGKNKTCDRHSC